MDAKTGARLAGVVSCPSCRLQLRLADSFAQCERCRVAVPIVDDFVMWNERFVNVDDARVRAAEIRGERDRYLMLLERKCDRRIYEPYAWFRPFNESTRALEAFRNLLTETVKPDTPILDVWCRTGWTGEMLASWFPENPVISIWEGDHDSLGYQGFLRWLAEGQRASNWDIVFASPGEPLPFASDYFGFVHGLDTLHRYPPAPLIGECLRVAMDDAPILFPHVHLTNSEPEPYFDRGCTQLHGTVWGDFVDGLCEHSDRRGWVLSEKDLYLIDDAMPLDDDRNTEHYNGFVALGPAWWHGRDLSPAQPTISADSFVFVNPLLSINSTLGRATVDRAALSGTVGHMVDRHPVAIQALQGVFDRQLSSVECQLLAHCARPVTMGMLASRLSLTVAELGDAMNQLVADNAVQIEAVSPAMANLQSHHRTLRPESEPSFAALWQTLSLRYGDRTMLAGADSSTFDFDDVNALINGVRHWFADAGLRKGDHLALVSASHVEYAITVWAAWLSGLVVVPFSSTLSIAAINRGLATANVKAIACDANSILVADRLTGNDPTVPCLIFDELDGTTPGDREFFADHVAPRLDRDPLPIVTSNADQVAAVLLTSGTSGTPKPVQLSMRSLLHSSTVVCDELGLRSTDRLLSLAEHHTMSGLRNPMVASLLAGATIVIDAECADSALAITEAVRRHSVSMLATSPAFIDRLAALGERVKPHALQQLKTIVTTADRLDSAHAAAVEARYDLRVIDYYGMTETGGIVVVAPESSEGQLGTPRGATVEVHLNDERIDDGRVGEIRIAGPGVMEGYLDGDGVRFENGWIYTGDLGIAHQDGSLSLIGRSAEQVKRRTGEIYPHAGVVGALQNEPRVHDAVVSVDETTRNVVLRVTATSQDQALDNEAIRAIIEDRCGIEGLPDRIELTS